ncbi:hypothetical protein [Streptomyces sp. S.PB5]|uniref:hypothetical protein n=1 Tax=Streptomyces sp. S.PB5 TaxID=3020844 RepID=UPI0025AF6DE0|nr:hypothetical protein [Streptomyces sp. S.PB5]MDN3027352.1 hypothetical protein [Streptomyces sp. S.PB5]
MNHLQRLLCTLYVATSAGLTWTTVLEYRHGPLWAACLFGAASLVPVIALARESEPRPRPAVGELWGVECAAEEDVVRIELDAACCERWWTSCGTDHDSSCPHRIPRSSAA